MEQECIYTLIVIVGKAFRLQLDFQVWFFRLFSWVLGHVLFVGNANLSTSDTRDRLLVCLLQLHCLLHHFLYHFFSLFHYSTASSISCFIISFRYFSRWKLTLRAPWQAPWRSLTCSENVLNWKSHCGQSLLFLAKIPQHPVSRFAQEPYNWQG